MEAAAENVHKMQGNAQATTGQSEDIHAVSHKIFVTDVIKYLLQM